MLQVSLAPGLPEGIALPQIVCYDELEGMDSIMWLGMENAIVINDRSACSVFLCTCYLHMSTLAYAIVDPWRVHSIFLMTDAINCL